MSWDQFQPLDLKPNLSVCDCEFTPYSPEELAGDQIGCEGEPWHFLRQCVNCGTQWRSLHCPHDGYQGSCPDCGTRGQQVKEVELGDSA